MTATSVWRYSHFILARSSFFFVATLAVTGAILAIEPITIQSYPYKTANLHQVSLASTISNLQTNNKEIVQIKVDANDFVSARIIDEKGKSKNYYINPLTGEIIGKIIPRNKFFRSVKNFHRSFFMKKTGRIIVGITSFLLFLIAISGTAIILKQGKGIRSFFTKTKRHTHSQFYHTILGKWNLVILLIIAFSGVYLSLQRFKIIKKERIKHAHKVIQKPKKVVSSKDFKIFQNTKLSSVKKVQFPFSDDIEDYYQLKLADKELLINQFDGSVISSVDKGFIHQLSGSMRSLHTAEGMSWWAVIICISSSCVLFFIYSGFDISLKRTKGKLRNTFSKDNAEFIILVGSENGSTMKFGKMLLHAISLAGKSVFITKLNDYTTYKKAEKFIILTSTYGNGTAPATGSLFLRKIEKNIPPNAQFAVVGFGSYAYEKFCQFAKDIQSQLEDNQCIFTTPLHLIHGANYDSFSGWATAYGRAVGLELQVVPPKQKKIATQEFTLLNRTESSEATDNMFLLEFTIPQQLNVQSGDILAIYPSDNHDARLYSIAITNQKILLSIKRHEKGICSTYLDGLEKNNRITGYVRKNATFYFPKKAKKVILIANGTGIAPFLGMIENNRNKVETHLFWGGRTISSYDLYKPYINENLKNSQLTSMNIAYSQEKELPKQYVQNIVESNQHLIIDCLNRRGEIMICGSVAMQNEVIQVLKSIIDVSCKKTFEQYHQQRKIKMDCY